MRVGPILVGAGALATLWALTSTSEASDAVAHPPVDPNAPKTGGKTFGVTMPTAVADREEEFFQAMLVGDMAVEWESVTSKDSGHTLVIPVMRRALAIGPEGDRLIVSMSFNGAQKMADMLDARLLTSKVADLMWQQADVKLAPITQSGWVKDQTMGSSKRMREQSDIIQAAVANRPGLVANEGKHWIVSKRDYSNLTPDGKNANTPQGTPQSKHNATNFGWYSEAASGRSPGGLHVIQSPGKQHGREHVDYSQLVQLMARWGDLDGESVELDDLVRDPEYAALLSDEGTLAALRHPDIPFGSVVA